MPGERSFRSRAGPSAAYLVDGDALGCAAGLVVVIFVNSLDPGVQDLSQADESFPNGAAHVAAGLAHTNTRPIDFDRDANWTGMNVTAGATLFLRRHSGSSGSANRKFQYIRVTLASSHLVRKGGSLLGERGSTAGGMAAALDLRRWLRRRQVPERATALRAEVR